MGSDPHQHRSPYRASEARICLNEHRKDIFYDALKAEVPELFFLTGEPEACLSIPQDLRQQGKHKRDKCRGCTLCARNCPVNAISGKVKEPHVIDPDKCIKCGLCVSNCHFNAIVKK